MRAKFIFPLTLLVMLGASCNFQNPPSSPALSRPLNHSSPSFLNSMRLASPAFQHNQNIPSKYTCDGANINPPLVISDVPPEAKSLVLIVDDPDAPAGVFVHWTVWNIAPTTKEIAENSVPIGAVEGITSFDKTGWGGPCPPSKTHRYFLKLYAISKTLDLASATSALELEAAIQSNIIARGELIGLYRRPRF